MKIYLNKNCHQPFLEHWIDFIICQMLVLSMMLRKNYGYICIWIAAMSILDGEMMVNNTQIKTPVKRRNPFIDCKKNIV